MDGDDVCSPDRFQKEYEVLENHPEFAVVSVFMNHYDDEENTVDFFTDLNSLRYVASPTFRNPQTYST